MQSLLKIAEDLAFYENNLRLHTNGLPMPLLKEEVESHIEHNVFLLDISQDADLDRLTKEGPIKLSLPRELVQVSGLATNLINAATWHAFRCGDSSKKGVNTKIIEALDILRKGIRKGFTDGVEVVAFNFSLPENTTIKTPWGIIRNWQSGDELLVFRGNKITESRGGVLLETYTKYQWTPTEFRVPIHSEDVRWQLITLAVLLTIDSQYSSPCLKWLTTCYCSFLRGCPGCEIRGDVPEGARIKLDQVANLEDWIEKLSKLNISEIALHRTVSMFERPSDSVDRFIDAVIVWEALFGTGDNSELSYRVSMNMACVLSSDPKIRVTYQEEIKKLYTLRSKIVHGGIRMRQIDACQCSIRSRVILMDAWRRLISIYPKLLNADAKMYTHFVMGVDP